ncbi:sister chromatid cohesion 1 protein 3 [Cynara cardunculus var. scolymus]|uniref:sister chromatid cohesion 1 protein 3 n=1 Tax=Cynara cardunculus var. scolymus TaxID=59895 RepID=UPI000D628B4D|nr:sister chromatid cohesion 1 protein 3 [Cynara cardunculus var. scolymus]
MFYSHNLLARKGPLGTVWCAAHLQSKLKKSNYVTVNIPSTVEQIMNPQVPIALRMSGHLLLGVVRIYSKKLEYLQHDYNVLRIDISKAYTYADINLPEDANQAKFESITLPENFALDVLDVDDYDPFGSPDTHLRRHEDISLMDQSPVSLSKNGNRTPAGYIMISLGEDVSRTPSVSRYNSRSSPMPMEASSHPLSPPETTAVVQEPDPNNQMGSGDSFIDDDNVTREVLRDAIHDDYLNMASLMPSDREEPDLVLEKQLSLEINNGSPALGEILVSGGHLSPVIKQMTPMDLAHSGPANDNSDPHISFGLASSPMAVQPSPSVEPAPAAEQPRAKRRKMQYDKATVLTNEFMKKSLDDPSNLLRKRKGVCSSLGVWKLNNTLKKEKVLFEPVITGLCHNLSQMFETGYMSKKPRLIETEQPHSDDMEVEHIRDFVGPNDNDTIPTYSPGDRTGIPSPKNGAFSSPREMDEYTPATGTDMGSKSYQVQTSVGTGVGSTPDPTSSSTYVFSDMETPTLFSQGQQGFENSGGLSDIPEVDDSGELTFLEDDEGTPMQRTPPEIGSLLARTRAVAQYIKEKSSATPSTPEREGAVSLNSILEGKRRKVCARMFMETLILKSCDLIDVKQDEAYGDITLKVTSKLLKQQF